MQKLQDQLSPLVKCQAKTHITVHTYTHTHISCHTHCDRRAERVGSSSVLTGTEVLDGGIIMTNEEIKNVKF